MHLALPPRKSSDPPQYTRTSPRPISSHRRRLVQFCGYTALCILTLYLVSTWIFSGVVTHDEATLPDNPSILIVTVWEEGETSEDYRTLIKTNREDYAARHGYKTFYTEATSYKSHYESAPSSWALIPALRHALTQHPETNYIWSLTPHALITNTTLNIYEHILQPLPNLMRKDIPVVPPDSVIHTFSHLTAATANLIVTQDFDNLAHTSFLLRNTQTITSQQAASAQKSQDTWTQFFLDVWFDPLYRAYTFQKAENHALEHIVQWHPTILAKLVVVDQRRLNSYNFQYPTGQKNKDTGELRQPPDSMWRDGDLVVNFKGCDGPDNQRDCEGEMRKYFGQWKETVQKVDGKVVDVKLKVADADYVPKQKQKEKGLSDFELKHIHI